MKTSLKHLEGILPALFKNNIVPFLHASPAIGKSSLAAQVANKYKLKLIDLRLTELDSVDMNGLPNFKDGKAIYSPFDVFPTTETKIPEGFKGWLLLLDEFNSALPSVQAAAYKLILNKQVGQFDLHKNCWIMACGNLDTDNAITNPMPTPLISRFANFYVELSHKDWIEWAIENGIDNRIISFLSFKPSLLYTFNPNATEPYASPRTWEMVSKVLKTSDDLVLLSSLIGDGTANEFLTYLALFKDIPNIKDILADPEHYTVPNNLSIQWATVSFCCEHVQENLSLVTYLRRFPLELQAVALRIIRSKNPVLLTKQSILDWLKELSSYV